MKKVLLIALLAAAVAAPSFAEDQDVVALQGCPDAVSGSTSSRRPRPAPAPEAPFPGAPQTPPAAPAPPAVAPAESSPNVRFDVTITDTGGAKPVTKTLSLTIWAGNSSGSIRNSAQVPNPAPPQGPIQQYSPTIGIPLNVDVRNVAMVETGIRASVAVEYQPYLPEAKTQPGMVTTNATTVFNDGRKTQILVTADPISDRKTTIEVTATILK